MVNEDHVDAVKIFTIGQATHTEAIEVTYGMYESVMIFTTTDDDGDDLRNRSPPSSKETPHMKLNYNRIVSIYYSDMLEYLKQTEFISEDVWN